MELFQLDYFTKLMQIIFVDLIFAGDNAIVIGVVAAKFTPTYRRKVVLYGVGVAVLLRIVFALMTVQLLALKGLLLVGGVLLVWICWKLWGDLRHPPRQHSPAVAAAATDPSNPPLAAAIWQIVLADLSMSLDNVLAVAGVAEGHTGLLVIGLALSVVFMTFAAALIAETLQKHRWIGYVGLFVILYVALKMLYQGGIEVLAMVRPLVSPLLSQWH